MGSYKKSRDEAWRYYKLWMSEKTICKALNKEVRITRKGWDHLLSRHSKRRKITDKLSRFELLKQAKHIIKTSSDISTKKENGLIYYTLKQYFKNKSKKELIKVVLRKDSQNNLIFFSVMKK